MTSTAEVASVRPVLERDLEALRALILTDPIPHCFVGARVSVGGVDPWRLGGDLLGYFTDGALASALYVGANLAPVATTAEARAAFAVRLRAGGRRCSSFVGRAEEVLDLWRLMEPAWGPAREVRTNQPLLVMDEDPAVPADPRVRMARPDDLDLLMPACIDMFTSEVGISPVAGGSQHAYRARIAELIDLGRSFVLIDDGRICFKAEIGAVSHNVCQVQGVWVAHDLRGKGLAAPCIAAVVRLARDRIASDVSLYVNDFNTAARKAYARVGFREHGEFATVLF